MSLIEIRNLTFAYPGSFDNVVEGLNLRLDTSWRLGLVGRNGRGKTTLLRLLLGEYEYSGAISAPAERRIFRPGWPIRRRTPAPCWSSWRRNCQKADF